MSNLLICPYCGHPKETKKPFEIHTCYRCTAKFLPIKKTKSARNETILTTKLAQGVNQNPALIDY